MASRTVEQNAHPTTDTEQVQRAFARDASAFRAIMRTHNRCLYRIARSILRNNADAEDAVQEAYIRPSPTLRAIAARGA
jgi:RNA polymerase sigma-70 factor, ECF subfamily